MRVAVVGAGSVGAVLGAKLAATGHEVTLIARGTHLAAIRSNGLTLVDKSANIRATTACLRATIRPRSVRRIS